ncbi:hypothetical protein K7X08_029144 [Anisodus acutangulus]|uniref:Uncharacterized protein n=1 Tax=Anisodus acutangulus TaxID=402998 RepID=A0A9Q1QTI1_9SOLA|nr:hypothetical protein K7X08_029144 [Anisodus acutangulus]
MLEDVFMDHMAARMIDHIATKIDDDENLVDALLKIQKSENQLTCDHIKAVIWVWPGEKETSNNLDWAISEMLKNPSVLQKPQQRSKQVFSAYGYVDETYFDELKYLRGYRHRSFPVLRFSIDGA